MAATLWGRCSEVLQQELGDQDFNTWIRPLHVVEDANTIRLLAPNTFVLNTVHDRFLDKIKEITINLGGDGLAVRAEIGGNENDYTVVEATPSKSPARKSKSRLGFQNRSNLNRDFTFDDLKRLCQLCQELDSKGCKFMLSNSNSKEVKKIFSNHSWNILKIEANRAINSDSKKRTGHSELIIKNY